MLSSPTRPSKTCTCARDGEAIISQHRLSPRLLRMQGRTHRLEVSLKLLKCCNLVMVRVITPDARKL